MNSLRTLLQALAFAALAMAATVVPDSPAAAQRPSTEMCPAPISTCRNAAGRDACPVGYVCTCVPSCPNCRDCATRVCVAGPTPECQTACDCSPGLGCFDGQCIAGFAPVFCCDAGPCPQGQQCQHRDGEMDRCSRNCDRVLDKATSKIDRVVRMAQRCRSDDECVRVDTWTACQGTCGAWVNDRYAPLVRRVVGYVDRRICDDYEGCPFAAPRCAAEEGVCRAGRCTGELRAVPQPNDRE